MWNQNSTAGASAVITVGFIAPYIAQATSGFGMAGPIGMGVVGLGAMYGGTKMEGHIGAAVTGAGAGLLVGAVLAYVNAPANNGA